MEPLHALQTKLKQHLPQLDLRVAEPMAKHTTFRVGGPAALLALPKGEGEVRQILQLAHQMGVAPFFLGKGSNLLVADEGVDRFLVKLPGGLTRLEREGEAGLYVGSGVTLAQAATFAAQAGLSGLEFAHGIPGSLGGGVFMNAGAYDGEMKNVADTVRTVDRKGKIHTYSRDELDLGYRHSRFQDNGEAIVEVELCLEPGDSEAIRAKMEDFTERRESKQPLEMPSAGSTFKRPKGYFAGTLIQETGLKGLQVGGAQVSTKHAGFVVNATGDATAADVRGLIHEVQQRVYKKHGVMLHPEVRIIGEA